MPKIKQNDPDQYGVYDAAHAGEDCRLHHALQRQPRPWLEARRRRVEQYRSRAEQMVPLFA